MKPNDLKKNNIEFGDSLTDFTTTYGKVFDQKNPLQQNNDNISYKIDKVEARKSNLVFGNDGQKYETQNNAAFKNNHITSNTHVHKESNTSNINLGSEGINYASEFKERFTTTKGFER